ncbi:hypothetical protein G6L37_03655 [Agrobacterium rubi]|nr:hypothetical protein [Agrobacterium rubi]NTF24451.1 hypothetical protein [Agrobacterium rubi]
MENLVFSVKKSLSPDLLKPEWRRIAKRKRCSVSGHCYAASEALYHLMGGSASGWVPQVLTHASWPNGLSKGQTHWFLKNRLTGAIIDATSEQFLPLAPQHDAGKGTGFLTRNPSRRASIIIERARVRQEANAVVAKQADAQR